MAVTKTEDHHHSREQVDRYLTEARAIADAAGLSDADRAAVLPVLVTLLSAKQVFYQEVSPLPAMHIPRNDRR